MYAAFFFHSSLRDRDQLANIFRGRVTQIDHDVRVDVRDLGVAFAKALEPTLIDKSSRADAFYLLEDRTRARMPLEPGMAAATPTQVLLEDALQVGLISTREIEGGR